MAIIFPGITRLADDGGYVLESGSKGAVVNTEVSNDGTNYNFTIKDNLPYGYNFTHNRNTVSGGWAALKEGASGTTVAAGTTFIANGTTLEVTGTSTQDIQGGSGAAILKASYEGVEFEAYVKLNQINYPFELGVGLGSPADTDSVSLTPVGENSFILHS